MRLSLLSFAFGLAAVALFAATPAHAQSGGAPSSTPPPSPTPRLTPRLRPRPAPPAPATTPAPAATPQRAAPATRPPAQASPGATTPQPPPPTTAVTPPPALPPGGFYPPVLPVYKDLPPPPGYVAKSSFNRSLLWSGGALLVVTYGGSLIYSSANSDEEGVGSLAVPLLGPWLALGKRKFDCDVGSVTGIPDPDVIEQSAEDAQACWANEVKVGAILTGLGVGQLVGAVMLAAGLIDQKNYWLRADLDSVSLRLDPLAGPSMAGVLASGSF